ncbi:uracil-DNA glycosylase [Ramlibacter sp. MMS24-I3-19]|uniref:uracil-DNA glycosylase n=1 Tax=Ramlibacter sp. MMS24-I3-19 TaxID=3416606 RepID=UPI003CFECA9E
MTLQLDARRVAMLREMGLHLLPPVQAPEAQPREEATRALPAAPPPTVARVQSPPTPAPAPSEVAARPISEDHDAGLGALDWDALEAAMHEVAAGRPAVLGTGPRRADWMVVGDAPGDADGAATEPFTGQAATLLENMLRAIGLERQRHVHVTTLLKCRPPGGRNPEPQELAQWEPFLRRQLALVQPRVILLMGRFAAQGLLRTPEPIGRLRGTVHGYEGVQVVVTYPPTYLLRNLHDKAKAWADLCLARDVMAGAQAGGSGR